MNVLEIITLTNVVFCIGLLYGMCFGGYAMKIRKISRIISGITIS